MSSAGGGKSLELMQQRLKQQQPPTAPDPQQPPQQQAAPEQQQQRQPTQQVAPPKRPGKDFAAMAKSVKNVKAVPSPTLPPQPTPPSAATAGKPKGKDFSAMANRNEGGKPKGKDLGAMAARMAPAPVVVQQQQQQHQPTPVQQPQPSLPPPHQQQQVTTPKSDAEAARQRQIDAARRAAGYIPMSTQAANMQAVAAKKMKSQQIMQVQAPQVKKQQQPPPHLPRGPPGSQLRRTSSQTMKLQQQQIPSQHIQNQQIQPQQQVGVPLQYPQIPATQQQQVQHRQPEQQPQPVAIGPPQPQQTPSVSVIAPPKPISSKSTPQPKAYESKLACQGSAAHMAPLVGQRLNDLVQSLDPNYSLDAQAEEEVLRLAQHFLDNVVSKSIRMSQHRGSKTLDVQDVQFVLAKQWGIVVPGMGPPTRPANRVTAVPKRKPETATPGSGGIQGGPAAKKAKMGV